MIDFFMLKFALIIMFIIVFKDILKRYYNFDMDSIDVKQLKPFLAVKNFHDLKQVWSNFTKQPVIIRNHGNKIVILKETGNNKATVMATLRQITDLDYLSAKKIVEKVPATIMVNVSDKEADLTKKALEFVGATVEIK